MQKEQKRNIVRLVCVLVLACLLAAGQAAELPYVYANTEGSADVAAAGPLAEKARAVTAEGIAAKEAADQEAARMAVKNPLTGLGGYSAAAVGKRPLAVVVENDPKARPQWGIDDPEKAPDIILEGEMEGGETRTLWLYADMNGLPSQVGPTRSARPPYIRFSELFDAIFIHCGLSHSSYDYTGADAVFEQDGVDHINMLTYGEGEGTLFGRDYSRTSMLEHTAFVRGEKVAETVAEFGFRTDLRESGMTEFTFRRDEPEEETEETAGSGLAAKYRQTCELTAFPPKPEEPVGKPCRTIDLSFSSITPAKHWEYSESDGMYHTQDYYTDVARTNVLVLFDETHYIVRANTWGSNSETYTNYELAGGSGKLAHEGRVEDITWSVQDGKLVLTGADGNPALLSPGRTWIGWGSSNHGGWAETAE